MSDMSSLSHGYASTTDFSRQINDAVLLLKKRFLRAKAPPADEQKLKEAISLVRDTVQTLRHRLNADATTPEGAERIPEDVLARIEDRYRANLTYFKQDLTRLQRAFDAGTSLEPAYIELLDSICEEADASAAATFRKLWRR